jgi:hypothetical protein
MCFGKAPTVCQMFDEVLLCINQMYVNVLFIPQEVYLMIFFCFGGTATGSLRARAAADATTTKTQLHTPQAHHMLNLYMSKLLFIYFSRSIDA